ncbi:MAG: hypothetical protein IH934_06580 [Nanoarchaeota archaeon]|nr:hypothetical protein [Nanoarchaeota archaeon]
MKITIDTKEDSHEEIQKVIKMLSSLVGQEVMSNQGDLFGDNSSTNTNQSSDMFSDDSSSSNLSGDSSSSSEGSSDSSESSGSPSESSGGMFNMFSSGPASDTSSENTTEETREDKEEEKDDDEKIDIEIPDVEEYH